jgi:hypothetical protein
MMIMFMAPSVRDRDSKGDARLEKIRRMLSHDLDSGSSLEQQVVCNIADGHCQMHRATCLHTIPGRCDRILLLWNDITVAEDFVLGTTDSEAKNDGFGLHEWIPSLGSPMLSSLGLQSSITACSN